MSDGNMNDIREHNSKYSLGTTYIFIHMYRGIQRFVYRIYAVYVPWKKACLLLEIHHSLDYTQCPISTVVILANRD